MTNCQGAFCQVNDGKQVKADSLFTQKHIQIYTQRVTILSQCKLFMLLSLNPRSDKIVKNIDIS